MPQLRYPIGIQSFQEIIEGGYVYIDKTSFIKRMIDEGKYYFLSRPRRFGKSLLLSTIKAYFDGRRDLFTGLDIASAPWEWTSHPVFYLNLVNADISDESGLSSLLESHFSKWEKLYGADPSESNFAQRFYGVIERSFLLTGEKAVVLVDEYDKPLFSTFDDPSLNDRFRNILKPIYATLKAADDFISFAILTGVTRFSRMSIFSDINNLRDISLDPAYAAVCGITENEMKRFLANGINEFARSNAMTYDEAVDNLKMNYDGYHFAKVSEDIYNPFSLFNSLVSNNIGSYWFASGTPTFLIERISEMAEPIRDIFKTKVRENSLLGLDTYGNDPTSLLFQSGYLTIKEYDSRTRFYTLGIPNREVEEGLYQALLPFTTHKSSKKVENDMEKLLLEVYEGKAENFMKRLKSFLADIPYTLTGHEKEIFFENNLYIIFKLLGCNVRCEYVTSDGRIDILLQTDDFVYLMELKLDGSASDALHQVKEKDYPLPFRRSGKKIFLIGINFSSKTRNISEWIIEEE